LPFPIIIMILSATEAFFADHEENGILIFVNMEIQHIH
jgi:hypothetical protein